MPHIGIKYKMCSLLRIKNVLMNQTKLWYVIQIPVSCILVFHCAKLHCFREQIIPQAALGLSFIPSFFFPQWPISRNFSSCIRFALELSEQTIKMRRHPRQLGSQSKLSEKQTKTTGAASSSF